MKVRGKSKEAVEPGAPASGAGTKVRTLKELVEAHNEAENEKDLLAVVQSLTAEEIVLMVNAGTDIEDQRRAIDKEVKATVEPVKKLLVALAQEVKKRTFRGTEGRVATVARGSKTTMGTVTEFVKILKREGKLGLFDSLVSVKLTETKKYVGEDALKGFITVTPIEYNSVSMKKS